jgi:hypothetical protein
MKLCLLVSPAPQTSYRFEHGGGLLTIGRGPECGLSLQDGLTQGVSWNHAACELTEAAVTLRDLGSTNGTYLNGKRIDGEARLAVGDEIRLGEKGPRLRVLELEGRASHSEYPSSAPSRPAYQPVDDDRGGSRLLMCPQCGQQTDSLKCYTFARLIVFLFIFGTVQKATYTLCPRCMRGTLATLALVNTLTANLLAPLVWVIYGVLFLMTFTRGHSRSLRT